MMMAAAMPSKSTGNFIAKRVVAFVREIGCEQGDVTLKSDQVGRVRAAAGGGKMIVESSPVGQSQSNGTAERAISSVAGQLRVLRDALEARLNVKLPANHPLVPWKVVWCSTGSKWGRTARRHMSRVRRRRAS